MKMSVLGGIMDGKPFFIKNRRRVIGLFCCLAMLFGVLGGLVTSGAFMGAQAGAMAVGIGVLWAAAFFFSVQALAYYRLSITEDEKILCMILPSVRYGVLCPPFRTHVFEWDAIDRITLVSKTIRVPIITTGSLQAMPYGKLIIEGGGQRAVLTSPMMKFEFSDFAEHVARRTGIIPLVRIETDA